QTRELAGKRRVDEQRAAKERIATELLASLEALKHAAAANPGARTDPKVALVARIEGDHLLLPWESDPATRGFREAMARTPAFAPKIAEAKQAECARRDLETVVRSYTEALHAAATPLQSAYARLLLARLLAKRGKTAEAEAQARQVLRAPVDM